MNAKRYDIVTVDGGQDRSAIATAGASRRGERESWRMQIARSGPPPG